MRPYAARSRLFRLKKWGTTCPLPPAHRRLVAPPFGKSAKNTSFEKSVKVVQLLLGQQFNCRWPCQIWLFLWLDCTKNNPFKLSLINISISFPSQFDYYCASVSQGQTDLHSLKGQCHEIFDFWFFSWISFPQSPEYTLRVVSNFLRKFAEIFAAKGLPPVSTTPVANAKNLQS
jgi:hypothetical protein